MACAHRSGTFPASADTAFFGFAGTRRPNPVSGGGSPMRSCDASDASAVVASEAIEPLSTSWFNITGKASPVVAGAGASAPPGTGAEKAEPSGRNRRRLAAGASRPGTVTWALCANAAPIEASQFAGFGETGESGICHCRAECQEFAVPTLRSNGLIDWFRSVFERVGRAMIFGPRVARIPLSWIH